MNSMNRIIVALGCLLFTGTISDSFFSTEILIPSANAVVGMPATPVSGAGAVRRTTRRVIRRSTIYVASLPTGCTTVVIEGTTLQQCGATYYQPYNNQYVVVYVE